MKLVLLIFFLGLSANAAIPKEEAVARARERYQEARERVRQLAAEYRKLEAETKKREAEARIIGLPNVCEGRLTLASGQPVLTADDNNNRRIFFTPYMGHGISVYYTNRWRYTQFTEMSIDLNAVAAAPSTNYDIFITRDSAGLLAMSLGTAWTDGTNRAPAGALAYQDGIPVLASDPTSRYVGTIRTDETASPNERVDDNSRFRHVWNYCNRVLRPLRMADTTNTWSYNGTAWRQAGADTSNAVIFVVGLNEDPVYAVVKGNAVSTDATRRSASMGVGISSTTLNSAQLMGGAAAGNASTMSLIWGRYFGFPGIGQHQLNWLESCTGCAGTTNATFAGDDGTPAKTRSGILAWVWM